MGHAYNNGLHTTSKGITYDNLRITGLNASPVIAEDCKSGLVASVSRSGAGIYVLQLSVPYPPKIVRCDAAMASAAATSTTLTARYQNNSYNSTTGQLTINVSGGANPTTPAATDPGAADEMHVHLAFNRYKN